MSFIIFIIIIIIFAIIMHADNASSDYTSSNAINMSTREFYEKVDKLTNSAYQSKTLSSIQDKLFELEDIQSRINNRYTKDIYKQYIADEIRGVREEYNAQAYDSWSEKADKILSDFFDSYDSIVSHTIISSGGTAKTISKKRCLSLYDKYFTLPIPPDFRLPKTRQQYAKDYFLSRCSYCIDMSSRHNIEQALDAAIQETKPEVQRLKKTYTSIISYVFKKQSIKRAELLKTEFDDITQEELKYIYKDLIDGGRLYEKKIGKYIFVSVSDSEANKLSKAK